MLQEAIPHSTGSLWRAEARATLHLAYPLILTNLAQALIHATDVVLLGWVGPETLAAGALGLNLYTAFLIFGLGLVTASAPMIARELGRPAAQRSRRPPHRPPGDVGVGRDRAADVGDCSGTPRPSCSRSASNRR